MKNSNCKFLVVADTSMIAYSMQITLFGIFDTYEEALDYVLKDETDYISTNPYSDEEQVFSFFEYYKDEDKSVSKEEYAKRFIKKFFDKTPTILGAYFE